MVEYLRPDPKVAVRCQLQSFTLLRVSRGNDGFNIGIMEK
jgi:hypothetical protein